MCSEIAINVSAVSKCFHIYDKPRDRLMQMLSRGSKRYYREFWALKDISFQIERGSTVGIVGRNGSGKSTLLQIICGTLNSTEGNIEANGRIAALLELGSGFNPEFTGRENVYMNASVLGLTKAETDARFDEITTFADIGLFIDQPVKTYSSGMLVRLAFAVAINADPEILIVDEALSVGDELFQRKCFARLEAIRSKGATILFVSHSGSTIVELCDHAILLDSGELLAQGHPKAIVSQYQKLMYAPAEKRETIRAAIKDGLTIQAVELDALDSAVTGDGVATDIDAEDFFDENLKSSSMVEFESHGAYIDHPYITDLNGRAVNNLVRGRTYVYNYRVQFERAAERVRFGMVIRTTTGLALGGAHSSSGNQVISIVESGTELLVSFQFNCLVNPGTYFVNAGVFGTSSDGQEETVMHRLVDAVVFRVAPIQNNLATELVDFGCTSSVTYL
ncbi:ABC transporter ATP-binding protein [Pseudomonas congelans]|jgi:lipopolysaccharide transport system ATP-binding protein|uniref:ABC transporter ATP-binding protein n=1 Tax=Pseudomonas congelans TaxID=200452 RepID=UPI0001E29E84|nr:ABC transporter ATP-binding protein [Pseudomonas congelans]PBQ12044.1 ABC transporter ATP-binding protein [Pseudomonas congelans]PBQ13367.1 ABC transporter ATP-binding protein [Pseudomonas congelans]